MGESINERIAVLENQMITVKDSLEHFDNKLSKLDDIHRELTRYKGFIGGVLFIISAFWTVLVFVKDWVKIKVGV